MTETWNQWEGRVVDGRFTLGRYLGGSDHSAVYACEIAQPEPRRVAIKFLAESPQEDLQLDRWVTAAGLSHPNLLPVLHSGTCRLDEQELLYVVMELAEENLGEILPQRALTPEETRGLLKPTLEALGYLHEKGLVHTRIKPSNIVAIGDQIKLSCDQICPAGAPMMQLGAKNLYEAPEAEAGTAVAASDIWSLGATLVEALTQHQPSWKSSPAGEPQLAESLPQPFQTIVAHTLVREPASRWNITDLKAELDPAAVRAMAARASAAPCSPTVVAAPRRQSVPSTVKPAPRVAPHDPPRPVTGRRISPLWYLIPGLGLAAVLVAWVSITRSTPSGSQDFSPVPATTNAASSAQPAKAPPSTEPKRAEKSPSRTARTEEKAADAAPKPAHLSSAVEQAKRAVDAGNGGQILDQVLPEVSQKALDTIRGTVRVTVRVQVNPDGSVSSTALDSPGPSKYFADKALEAAQKWEFMSPEVNGHSVASEWLVRFEFKQTSTKAYPKQVTP